MEKKKKNTLTGFYQHLELQGTNGFNFQAMRGIFRLKETLDYNAFSNIKGCQWDMCRKREPLLIYMFCWFATRHILSGQKCVFMLEQDRDFRAASVKVEAGSLVEHTDGPSFYYFLFQS